MSQFVFVFNWFKLFYTRKELTKAEKTKKKKVEKKRSFYDAIAVILSRLI